MLNEMKENFELAFHKAAKEKVLEKLKDCGVDFQIVPVAKLDELIAIESQIIATETKNVSSGIAIGVSLTLLTGGLF